MFDNLAFRNFWKTYNRKTTFHWQVENRAIVRTYTNISWYGTCLYEAIIITNIKTFTLDILHTCNSRLVHTFIIQPIIFSTRTWIWNWDYESIASRYRVTNIWSNEFISFIPRCSYSTHMLTIQSNIKNKQLNTG